MAVLDKPGPLCLHLHWATGLQDEPHINYLHVRFGWMDTVLKTSEQGYAPAQHNLGHCYLNGLGVELNQTEGIKWYTKSYEWVKTEAENGNPYAQHNL